MGTKNNGQFVGQTNTNSTNVGSSTSRQEVEGEPLAFLHTGSGEIVIVPPEQSGQLLTEARLLSDAVAQYHAANIAVQLLDEYKRLNWMNASPADKAQMDKAIDNAVQVQDQAYKKLRELYMDLEALSEESQEDTATTSSADSGAGSYGVSGSWDEQKKEDKEDTLNLNGTAKKMTELVSLKGMTAEERAKKQEEAKKLESKDGAYVKKLLYAPDPDHLREIAKWKGNPNERIIYVRRDKINWPKLKITDNAGWKDVHVTDPKTGKKSIDQTKLRKYVADKSVKSGVDWLKKKFKDYLEYSHSDTIDCGVFKVFDTWNKQLNAEKSVQYDNNVLPVGVELAASAQLMRYSYGVSLDPDLEFSAKKISVKAEGHAEINVAKGEAALTLSFPRKEGWIWWRTGKNGDEQEIVAIVCEVKLSASAVVGASIAGELSIHVEGKEVGQSPKRVKGKPGKAGYKDRRMNRMQLKKGDEVNPAGLDAELSVFAGAKADASIEGALKWRDPEDQENNEFATIASIKPAVGGMAGLAGELKFSIEYVKGMFKATAHASLCFGLGAEGAVNFSIGKDEIINFGKCIFYKIAYAQFENIGAFINNSFKIYNNFRILEAVNGGSLLDYYDKGITDVRISQLAESALSTSTAQQLLAAADPDVLKYSLPETKGALICRMCELQVVAQNDSTQPSMLGGILNILKTSITVPELENTIQHATHDGSKGVTELIMVQLENLFKIGMNGSGGNSNDLASNTGDMSTNSIDQIALSGDFTGWHSAFSAHLMDRLPRGFPVVPPDSPEYEVLRASVDHPLYTSDGWNAFYREEVV